MQHQAWSRQDLSRKGFSRGRADAHAPSLRDSSLITFAGSRERIDVLVRFPGPERRTSPRCHAAASRRLHGGSDLKRLSASSCLRAAVARSRSMTHRQARDRPPWAVDRAVHGLGVPRSSGHGCSSRRPPAVALRGAEPPAGPPSAGPTRLAPRLSCAVERGAVDPPGLRVPVASDDREAEARVAAGAGRPARPVERGLVLSAPLSGSETRSGRIPHNPRGLRTVPRVRFEAPGTPCAHFPYYGRRNFPP